MAPTQMVEEFRTASRPLLKLFRAFTLENRLTEVEEAIIAAKIDALRAELPDWKKRRTRMSLRSSG